MTRQTIYVAMLVVASSWMSGCQSCNHEPKNAVRMPMPTGTPARPQGMKALTVRAGTEPFTKADVTQYIRTHALPKSLGDPSQIDVSNLEFLTARQATDRLRGASTGLSDGDRVALATITGRLIFTGPPQSKPVAFRSAYVLFDAVSGNLVMMGTLEAGENQPPDQPPPR
jgi:hypothetical protein